MADEKFKFTIPAQLSKSEDGDWKVYGLASTASKDLQGEVIDQNGLDLTPLDMKKGVLNWDHQRGPENTIGVIDSYKKTGKGLYLGGRLFKNHTRAKAIHEIMSSLSKSDTGRIGMSVEGVIKKRDGKDGKVIKNAVINACALTMNPVNTDTYATLIKSLSSEDSNLDFSEGTEDSSSEKINTENYGNIPVFTANQVLSMMEKALSISTEGPAAKPPAEREGGDALSISNMSTEDQDDENDKKKKKKKKMKKGDMNFYKSQINSILNRLQELYPEQTRSDIWNAVRDRLKTQYPIIKNELK